MGTDKDWKKESCKDYYSVVNDDCGVGPAAVQAGAIMRMANALEAIAKSKVDLEEEADGLRAMLVRMNGMYNAKCRSHAARKGVITKLRKELARVREGSDG